jgi:hypothetical protein
MIVGLASNASEPTSSKVIGLAASTGAINDQIFVVTEGLIAGLNTSTATAGDPVWLGTGGNLIFGLLNKPVAPAHLVYLGVVTRVQQNNGEIFVNVQNGFELHELHDVLISSPSAGQLLRRDSDGLWKNWSPNFLTAEADTLQTVTTRGASTSLAISANGVTSPNFTSTALMIINADSSGSLQPDQGSPANKILSFRWQGLEGGYIDTNNVITFAGFKTPTGTASQFLKANGTVDSSTYLTTTTAAATYATFGYVDDEITAVNTYVQDYFVPKTRTLTINGTSYDLSANRSWTIATTDSTKVSRSGESHDTVEPNNLGAGDGGFYTVKNGFGPSGGNDALIHIPYSNSLWAHQLAFDWALGNDQDMWFRTKNNGTWQGWRKVWHDGNFTDNSTNWNTAYNDRITTASVTGTSTKTLTLTQGDGGTVTATWTDYDTDTDAQQLTWDPAQTELSISGGNDVTLTGLATEDYVNSQGFVTSVQNLAIQTIGGDSGAFNLDTVSGQHGFVRFSTGAWAGTNPYPGNYSHILSINQSTTSGNRFVQMYLGDVPGALFWRMNQGGTIHPWERIWTAGNDGAASGLDADLLDGNHASAFALASHNHDDRYYTETESDSRFVNASGDTMSGSLSFDAAAVIKKKITGVGDNPVKTASGVLASRSDNGGGYTYYVIETNVPQDDYQMGGFTIELLGNYGSTNAKTKIDLGGYWNAESNGGFVGFEAHGTNPQYKPTIEVSRNSEGKTAFIIYGGGWSYPVIVARDLWLGYSQTDGSTYGEGWTIRGTNDVSSYTNKDTVVWRNAYSDSNPAGYITGYTETDTLATVTGRGASTNTFTSLLGGSKLVVQNATDGGNSRGIFMWTSGDPNWGIYMSTATAGVSLAGGNAVSSIDGRTSHHIRFRVASSVGNGFIWENSSEVALMSLNANTGSLYTRGEIYAGNNTSNLVWHAGNLNPSGFVATSGAEFTGPVIVNVGDVAVDTMAFKVAGPSDYDSLTIGMRGTPDYDSYIASFGNDIHFYSGKGVTTENHSFFWYTSKAGSQQHGVVAMTLDHLQNLTIGGTYTENSSIRYKDNITPLESVSGKVEKLEAVTYTKKGDELVQLGLIAESVSELFPEIVKYDEEGRPDGVSYTRLSVILLKALQEQNAVIAALTERVNKLENK